VVGEYEGDVGGGGGGQLVRPVRGVRITFRRPDIDYSLSNRAVVDVRKKKIGNNSTNLVRSVLKINRTTYISDLKSFIYMR